MIYLCKYISVYIVEKRKNQKRKNQKKLFKKMGGISVKDLLR